MKNKKKVIRIDPNRTTKKMVSVRFDPELLLRAQGFCDKNKVTFTSVLTSLLTEFLDRKLNK